MNKSMKEIISLMAKVKEDTMLFPTGTWGKDMYFKDGSSFRGYTNDSRDYISLEYKDKDGKDIMKLTLSEYSDGTNLEIGGLVKNYPNLSKTALIIKTILNYRKAGDYGATTQNLLNLIRQRKNSIRNDKSQIKEMEKQLKVLQKI